MFPEVKMAACPKTLFISYGREQEAVPFVHRLKSDLESAGFHCWLDADDIPAGSDWHGAIGTGLDACKAILCVVSNKYIQSRYVRLHVVISEFLNPTQMYLLYAFLRMQLFFLICRYFHCLCILPVVAEPLLMSR